MAITATGDLPDDNLQAQAIGMIFAFPAVATVAVLLRVYIRLWTRSFAAGKRLQIQATRPFPHADRDRRLGDMRGRGK
jgi:hypothetical protein